MRPNFTNINDPDFMRRLEDELERRPEEGTRIGSIRPTDTRLGGSFFDSTLGKPIWAASESAGVITWVDATGTTV